jgi:signal transduction histidine kinase
MIVFNHEQKIVYTNLGKQDISNLRDLDIKDSKEYIKVSRPIQTASGRFAGNVVLIAELKDLKSLNRLMFRTQFISFMIAGIVALMVGLIFGRSLTKPIRLLMKSMQSFSPKNEFEELHIRTRDEIEELSVCFSNLGRKLKIADQQQKWFLQNASHELKTPLMSIQGNAEAIKDGIIKENEVEESLDIIISECQRLKSVVDEMIYLTKLENVEETFSFEYKNIVQMIDEAIKSVKPLAEQKGIELSKVGSMDYKGKFDEEKLTRALINILGNGIRYAKKRITVTITLLTDKIEIVIIDDGLGFQPGEEQKIFDRFYKGAQGGTGIGLALTKAIIEGHQGTVKAFRHQPAGTMIKITLPLNG